MSKQPDITASMRSVLVDWLVEVTDEFSLQPETLYLAVSITDRFLSCMSVLRGKLQLVGTTAMYIAAKLEEIYPPELTDFAYITDDTYSKQQVSYAAGKTSTGGFPPRPLPSADCAHGEADPAGS